MVDRICLVGLDEPESSAIQGRLGGMKVIAHDMLPRILVKDGQLLVESPSGVRFVPVSKVVFHGIFEEDFDFIAALALWGGPCLPNALGMMDCRLKLPCLVRALRYTRFGTPRRGYAAPGTAFDSDRERVAKWGNWHCGEDKARFDGSWTASVPTLFEEFIEGEAVRIVLVGEIGRAHV